MTRFSVRWNRSGPARKAAPSVPWEPGPRSSEPRPVPRPLQVWVRPPLPPAVIQEQGEFPVYHQGSADPLAKGVRGWEAPLDNSIVQPLKPDAVPVHVGKERLDLIVVQVGEVHTSRLPARVGGRHAGGEWIGSELNRHSRL